MPAIEWDPSLETGNPRIDAQHKRLFALVNELRDACVEGRERSATSVVLCALADYVDGHFAAEQELMTQTGYPVDQMLTHVAAHRELAERTADIVGRHERGELTTVLPLTEFLVDWLRTHIRQTDRAFVSWLRGSAEPA